MESVEVGGFAGFVVGLAMLPHVVYALVVSFNVAVRGEGFSFGPFGLELISITVTLGLTLWSLGSFVQRGRGLPAGPLGLLGLSEGIGYLAALGLAIATVVANVRSGGAKLPSVSVPPMPAISVPKLPSSFKAPDVNVPDFKVPDFKVPEIKVPDFKVPDIKVPDVTLPKVSDFQVPELKLPEVKLPEKKGPEKVPEKSPGKILEAPAPKPAPPPAKAPEAKPPPAKGIKLPDFGELWDD